MRLADHLLTTVDEVEVRSLYPMSMTVVGSPERGYALHRGIRERPFRLKSKSLDEATAEAIRAVMAVANENDLFRPPSSPVTAQRAGMVYFIGGDVGAVKIGFAVNPDSRLRGLQCGSPIPLRILAVAEGVPKDERDYHRRFKPHRLHGEWFERCPEIQAEIDRLSRNPPGEQ